MKNVYPIILTPDNGMYLVNIPDFDIMTQGESLGDAIDMARDAICITAIDLLDDGKALPEASEMSAVNADKGSAVTLVDVDFDAYRKALDNRAVRKNCTIPSWLNTKAEAAGVNFSAVLQKALMNELHLS